MSADREIDSLMEMFHHKLDLGDDSRANPDIYVDDKIARQHFNWLFHKQDLVRRSERFHAGKARRTRMDKDYYRRIQATADKKLFEEIANDIKAYRANPNIGENESVESFKKRHNENLANELFIMFLAHNLRSRMVGAIISSFFRKEAESENEFNLQLE